MVLRNHQISIEYLISRDMDELEELIHTAGRMIENLYRRYRDGVPRARFLTFCCHEDIKLINMAIAKKRGDPKSYSIEKHTFWEGTDPDGLSAPRKILMRKEMVSGKLQFKVTFSAAPYAGRHMLIERSACFDTYDKAEEYYEKLVAELYK